MVIYMKITKLLIVLLVLILSSCKQVDVPSDVDCDLTPTHESCVVDEVDCSVTPEHEDCRKIADAKELPLKLVYNAAINAAQSIKDKT